MELVEKELFNNIWDKQPVVVIDTNVLLDLYRYSALTADNILRNFAFVIDNIWIPNQVWKEFNDNREKVRNEAFNKYKDVQSDINRIIDKAKREFTSKFSHYGKLQFPRINKLKETVEDRLNELSSEVNRFSHEIKDEIEANTKLLREDLPLVLIQEMGKRGKVGEPFSIEKILQLYKEGEQRYKYCIPPGYMDIVKDKEDDTKTKKFGDLFFWKQILKEASELDKPFILVTNETKPDWWLLENDKTIKAPRNELIQEFNDVAKRKGEFIMLSLGEFIKNISPITKINSINSWIEINKEDLAYEFFDTADWENKVQDELLGFLSVDPLMHDVLRNGELIEIEEMDFNGFPDLQNITIQFEDEYAVIEGEFEFSSRTNLTVHFSGEYPDSIECDIVVCAKFHLSLFIDYENDDDFIDDVNYEFDFDDFKVKKITTSDELCTICGKAEGVYNHSNDELICEGCLGKCDVCTQCGTVFDEGELNGNLCDDCEMGNDY